MSQWGETRTVGGVSYIPHVESPTWEEAKGFHMIGFVLKIDSGGKADEDHKEMHAFVGRKYSDWLALKST